MCMHIQNYKCIHNTAYIHLLKMCRNHADELEEEDDLSGLLDKLAEDELEDELEEEDEPSGPPCSNDAPFG